MQVTRFMLKCRLYVSMSAIWRRNMWFAIRKYSHAAKERSDVFISFTYINILFDVGGVVALFRISSSLHVGFLDIRSKTIR